MLRNFSLENNINFVVGLDEVGRGCLAGPLVTAGVILPKNFTHPLIKDSKKLTEKKRLEAFDIIVKNAIAYDISASSVKEINKYGINPATIISMSKNLDKINEKFDINHLLIDGNQWTDWNNKPFTLVPKGDSIFLSIASASILAKVKRDEYMVKLSQILPNYNFENSKGYRCKKHDKALLEIGPSDYHRTIFTETRLKNLNSNV